MVLDLTQASQFSIVTQFEAYAKKYSGKIVPEKYLTAWSEGGLTKPAARLHRIDESQ